MRWAPAARVAGFVAVLLVAWLYIHGFEQQLFANQESSCHSGNVVRFVTHDIAEATIEARTEAAKASTGHERAIDLKDAARYTRDKNLLEHVPYGQPNGTRDCTKAVKR
jgi:hypothetical protein